MNETIYVDVKKEQMPAQIPNSFNPSIYPQLSFESQQGISFLLSDGKLCDLTNGSDSVLPLIPVPLLSVCVFIMSI